MRRYRRSARCLLAGVLLAVGGCKGGTVTNDDWAKYGRDDAEQRFSPLEQINSGNVDRLKLAWSLDLPDENSFQATPIVVKGVIYFSSGLGRVYAVDARTGKQRWVFDSHQTRTDPAAVARMMNVNRGVAVWDDKIYLATLDGRMIAIDADTGAPVWTTKFLLDGTRATSSGAPRIFDGKVIIGNSGSEYFARGYVTTMDARTGKILWRFYTTPGDPKAAGTENFPDFARKTWADGYWRYGGVGGTPWSAITYDGDYKQILVGTGNGFPYLSGFRAPEGKDNLFLSSVVALDADTGAYKWHYQYNPRETWDWKAASSIILADLKIGGRDRKVMMQAPSNGFFYVIDRSNGKLLSAEKWAKATWADRIDLATGRPVERPNIRAETGETIIYPGLQGAQNWQASSYSPDTGLVYLPRVQTGAKFTRSAAAEARVEANNGRNLMEPGIDVVTYLDPKDPLDGRASLVAWDPVRQKQAWRVDYPNRFVTGTAVTRGGVVFQGIVEGLLYAYDARTGKRLWSFNVKTGLSASPITFAVDGKQYVAILTGQGGTVNEGVRGSYLGWKYKAHVRRLLVFALDGKGKLPETPAPDFSLYPLDDPKLTLSPARVSQGEILYHSACSTCHGGSVASAGGAPDLRESAAALDPAAFRSVVKDGIMMENGMPRFDVLTDEEMLSIFQYIRSQARKALRGEEPPKNDRAGHG